MASRLKRPRLCGPTEAINLHHFGQSIDNEEPPSHLYTSEHRILIFGCGNFSWELAMAEWLHNSNSSSSSRNGGCNITATSFDTEDQLQMKYGCDIVNVLNSLRALGVSLFHDVDATAPPSIISSQGATWDRVVFNFPHSGGKSKIGINRKLMAGFFRVAATLMRPCGGQVHVALKAGQGGSALDIEQRKRQNHWQVQESAADAFLQLVCVEPFRHWWTRRKELKPSGDNSMTTNVEKEDHSNNIKYTNNDDDDGNDGNGLKRRKDTDNPWVPDSEEGYAPSGRRESCKTFNIVSSLLHIFERSSRTCGWSEDRFTTEMALASHPDIEARQLAMTVNSWLKPICSDHRHISAIRRDEPQMTGIEAALWPAKRNYAWTALSLSLGQRDTPGVGSVLFGGGVAIDVEVNKYRAGICDSEAILQINRSLCSSLQRFLDISDSGVFHDCHRVPSMPRHKQLLPCCSCQRMLNDAWITDSVSANEAEGISEKETRELLNADAMWHNSELGEDCVCPTCRYGIKGIPVSNLDGEVVARLSAGSTSGIVAGLVQEGGDLGKLFGGAGWPVYRIVEAFALSKGGDDSENEVNLRTVINNVLGDLLLPDHRISFERRPSDCKMCKRFDIFVNGGVTTKIATGGLSYYDINGTSSWVFMVRFGVEKMTMACLGLTDIRELNGFGGCLEQLVAVRSGEGKFLTNNNAIIKDASQPSRNHQHTHKVPVAVAMEKLPASECSVFVKPGISIVEAHWIFCRLLWLSAGRWVGHCTLRDIFLREGARSCGYRIRFHSPGVVFGERWARLISEAFYHDLQCYLDGMLVIRMHGYAWTKDRITSTS